MELEQKLSKLLTLQEDLIKELQHLRLTTQKLIDNLDSKSQKATKEDISEFWEDYLTGLESFISYIDSDENGDYFECKGLKGLVLLGTVLQEAYRDDMLGDGYAITDIQQNEDDTYIVKVEYEW